MGEPQVIVFSEDEVNHLVEKIARKVDLADGEKKLLTAIFAAAAGCTTPVAATVCALPAPQVAGELPANDTVAALIHSLLNAYVADIDPPSMHGMFARAAKVSRNADRP